MAQEPVILDFGNGDIRKVSAGQRRVLYPDVNEYEPPVAATPKKKKTAAKKTATTTEQTP